MYRILGNKWMIIFIFMIVSLGCTTYKPQFDGVPFNRFTTLETTGSMEEKLDLLTEMLTKNFTTTGMVILKNGKILFEYGDISKVTYIASCRKSILSILYGKYVENGTIDLNQTIGDIGIDENRGLLDIEKTATVEHIITARSGVFYKPANKGYDEDHVLKRGSVKPGEYFVYNNWDFNVAGSIFEKKSGNDIYKELEEQLAIPLDFQDWNIKNQHKTQNKSKSKYSAYHMYLSTRDMAKIGQLMLNKGEWNGKQIISKNWISKIITTVTPVDIVNSRNGLDKSSDFQLSYGYMWWLIDNIKNHPDFEGAYSATGYGGQFITVIPKLNIVVAHKTQLKLFQNDVTNNQYWELLYKYIANEL